MLGVLQGIEYIYKPWRLLAVLAMEACIYDFICSAMTLTWEVPNNNLSLSLDLQKLELTQSIKLKS